jgi:flagellar motor switch protein FliN/FliY
MSNHDNHQSPRRFAQGFSEALSESLTDAAGHPWKLTVLDSSDPSTQRGPAIIFWLTIEGALRGEFFLEFYEPQVRELAASICGHAVQAFSNEDGEALRKVISSATVRFCTSLTADYGTVTCRVERVANPALNEMLVMPLAADGEASSPMPVTIYLDGKLVESLSSETRTRDAAGEDRNRIDPVNLNLVMDVELSMSLRFGQRQLPLREVLELASGSVVELDRQVDDPVELLLDGRVIARGEAVIVDGNYGLRVTEITEPIASHFVR